jgi:hypothetical protein
VESYTGNPKEDYGTFLRAVFAQINLKIGAGAGAYKSLGDYENVEFTAGMELGDSGKMGDVHFAVTLLNDGPGRGKSRKTKLEWYAHPDAAKVASDLLRLYNDLRDAYAVSASHAWTEWHLTPRGWERGTRSEDLRLEAVAPPVDRVESWIVDEVISDVYSKPERHKNRKWSCDDQAAIGALRLQFGDCPDRP